MHKFHYTYKIINKVTNEFYIGVRSCSWDISITDFIKMFPDQQLNPNSMRKAA
jgi:hypothetical protein